MRIRNYQADDLAAASPSSDLMPQGAMRSVASRRMIQLATQFRATWNVLRGRYAAPQDEGVGDSNLRDLASQHVRTVAGALGRFLEFLDHPVPLELGDVVDEENAIEMVDLMLEYGGEQALGQDLAFLPLAVEGAGAHRRGTLDLGVIFRDRETALLVGRTLFRRPHDFGIDEDLRVARLFLLGGVDHQKTDWLGDLNGRESHAWRVVHGFDHIVDQLAQTIVDAFDCLADETQLGVGQNDDRFEGHAGLFAGEARGLIVGWTSAVKRVLTLFDLPGESNWYKRSFGTLTYWSPKSALKELLRYVKMIKLGLQ